MFQNISGTIAGDTAEVYACSVLMGMGFVVYKNTSRAGEHDLVIMQKGSYEALPVDVTLGRWVTRKYLKGKTLAHNAVGKLRDKGRHTVLVVAESGELYLCYEYSYPEFPRYSGEVTAHLLPLSPDVILARFGALK